MIYVKNINVFYVKPLYGELWRHYSFMFGWDRVLKDDDSYSVW